MSLRAACRANIPGLHEQIIQHHNPRAHTDHEASSTEFHNKRCIAAAVLHTTTCQDSSILVINPPGASQPRLCQHSCSWSPGRRAHTQGALVPML
jgi:hypothetical protein